MIGFSNLQKKSHAVKCPVNLIKVKLEEDFMKRLFDDAYAIFFFWFPFWKHNFMLWALIWIASTNQGNSYECLQRMLL